jgi:predicted DCC family thiol-disulfide oxidoreductase YuxK
MSNCEPSAEKSVASWACVLLYDGDCGLCLRSVQWLVRHDPEERLSFAPLQQALAGAVLARYALDWEQIDSAVLVLHRGETGERLLLRSDAILGCLSTLGGRWAVVAGFARLVPRRLRDRTYQWIARHRQRIGSCVRLTPAERAARLGSG